MPASPNGIEATPGPSLAFPAFVPPAHERGPPARDGLIADFAGMTNQPQEALF
jgi:hypothetical protein